MSIFKSRKEVAELKSKLLGARLVAIVANDRLGGMQYTTTTKSKSQSVSIPSFLLKRTA
jgi:hypothetical protein